MAKVILFGGGDGGGLLIGPGGVRPIPPFDPGILAQLRGVAALTKGALLSNKEHAQTLFTLANRAANNAIGEIEGIVGPLDAEGSLVFQDDDGGFTCGSTGKPVLPFPWPAPHVFDLGDLVSSGVLERELIDFLSAGKVDVKALLADPRGTAAKAGVRLSERSLEQLSRIAPGQAADIPSAEGREVAQFFNKVVEDGRFLDSWSSRPYDVSKALGVKLSDGALDRIAAGGGSLIHLGGAGGETANAAIGVAVAVGIVIMLVTRDAGLIPIRDASNIQKF